MQKLDLIGYVWDDSLGKTFGPEQFYFYFKFNLH